MVRVGFLSAAARIRQNGDGSRTSLRARVRGNNSYDRAGKLSAVIMMAAAAVLPQASARATPAGVTFSNLYSFGASSSASGQFPMAGLTLSKANGNYYGVTHSGGANYTGTVYQLTPSGTVTTVYSFGVLASNGTNADGATPSGPLTLDASGNLYGVTQSGGPSGSGTVFKITMSGTYTLLYGFSSSANGSNPSGRLVLGSDGNLYGSTALGGPNNTGVVYRLSPSTGSYNVLHAFASGSANSANSDGNEPTGLVVGTNGNLYGTTVIGGAGNSGTIFEISTTGSFTSLYDFSAITRTGGNSSNNDGEYPNSDLAFDSSGNLYGTTQRGGANNNGTIYEFSASGGFTALHSFGSVSSSENADGAAPYSGLIYASDGNLYGTTESGGSNGKGTIYKITPSGTLTTLHIFNGDTGSGNSDGANPYTALTIGADGDLYGTTEQGGASDKGVIFKTYVGVALTAPTPPATPVSATRFDFNKDGHADLVWYNTGTGGVSVWDMNDQSVLQYGATFTQLAPSSGWVPVATPDVNNDGYPDLMWWNDQTGAMSFWTLQNTTVTNYGGTFATISDTTWKPVAAADVTGTTWELVFQNTASGAISVWQMNGQTVTSYGGAIGSVGAGTGWQVVGAPDLNGDGKSDLLFWNSLTGEVSSWTCNLANAQVLAYNGDFAQVSDTSWHLAGSEDTNGDGHPDLIWWNAGSGIESRWLLDRTTVEQYGGESTQVTDTTWQPTAIR